MSDSPSSAWYDPPEPRHSDKSHIPDECNCEECHEGHVEENIVYENSKLPDYECCKDEMDSWYHSGAACQKHPTAYCEVENLDLFLTEKQDANGNRLGFYCEACSENLSGTSSPESNQK